MHTDYTVATCQAAMTILIDELLKKAGTTETYDKAKYDAAHAILLDAFNDAAKYRQSQAHA